MSRVHMAIQRSNGPLLASSRLWDFVGLTGYFTVGVEMLWIFACWIGILFMTLDQFTCIFCGIGTWLSPFLTF